MASCDFNECPLNEIWYYTDGFIVIFRRYMSFVEEYSGFYRGVEGYSVFPDGLQRDIEVL